MSGKDTLHEMLDAMHSPEVRDAACEAHGMFQSRRVFGAVWTKCSACTAEAEIEEKAKREAQEKERAQRLWQSKIGSAGIPERFQDRSLQSYVAATEGQRRALAFAEAYAGTFDEALETGRSALFLGKPGTGKTHLAIGIGLRIMRRDNRTVLFCTVMRALRRVKDTWSRGSEMSETEAVESLAFPDLLILDEVGVQFGSETEKLILFDVLNERYERRRPTLMLSNLALDEVKAYLGERIFDRIREDKGEAIVFDWESHRGQA
jgi:DNA replication protein DnaC